jgi:hypothetical protein
MQHSTANRDRDHSIRASGRSVKERHWRRRRDRIFGAGAWAALLLSWSHIPGWTQPATSTASNEGSAIRVQGHVVCLEEEIQKTAGAEIRSDHRHLWGLKTRDGTLYTLLDTLQSEALFLDKRLREKELIVKGRVFPKSQLLEANSLQSVRNGRIYDLYYYCFTCSIKSITPRECACCQQPVELMEVPATP